ncbi:MAG: ferredoxin [Bacteroidales bacterium]|nr:ferredoxin [Bacteroidales bacterium]
MAIYTEQEIISRNLRDVADKMITAARTAPKARGRNNLVFLLVEGDDLEKLAQKMEELGEKTNAYFFGRDANDIRRSEVLILFGTRIKTLDLPYCGWCGFADCAEKNHHSDNPCAFNNIDLGIAIGSAVSVAMDHRVDNRIMYTVGQAARDLGLFDPEVRIILGVPLSATSKNIYFNRPAIK